MHLETESWLLILTFFAHKLSNVSQLKAACSLLTKIRPWLHFMHFSKMRRKLKISRFRDILFKLSKVTFVRRNVMNLKYNEAFSFFELKE